MTTTTTTTTEEEAITSGRKSKSNYNYKIEQEQAATATATAAREVEKQAATATSLLKIIEDMLHNKIKHKKEQVHKTKNIAQNDKLSIEMDTLQWVLSQCLSIRRLLKGEQSELSYDTTTITKDLMMRR